MEIAHSKKYQEKLLDVRETRLTNGLTILTGKTDSPFVMVKIAFRVGSRHDRIPGEAHFLEHVLFEGGAREWIHPRLRHLEAKGLKSNAGTTSKMTDYWTMSFAENFNELLDALIDICCFRAEIRPRDVEMARGPILQEARQLDWDWGWQGWVRHAFFPDQSFFHHPTQGTADSIAHIQTADIARFYRDHYHAANAAIIVTGGIEHDAIITRILTHPFAISSRFPESPPRDLPPARTGRFLFEAHESDVSSMNFYRTHCPEQYTPAWNQFETASHILRGKLYYNLRRQTGLVYEIGDELVPGFRGTGRMHLKIPTHPRNFRHIEETVREEMEAMKRGEIGERAFEIFQANQRMFFASRTRPSTEDLSSHLCDKWIDGTLDKLTYDPAETILSLTCDDIIASARQYFHHEDFGLIASVADSDK